MERQNFGSNAKAGRLHLSPDGEGCKSLKQRSVKTVKIDAKQLPLPVVVRRTG
jgi:hypothetical protein